MNGAQNSGELPSDGDKLLNMLEKMGLIKLRFYWECVNILVQCNYDTYSSENIL
jgi:hypothetical protein